MAPAPLRARSIGSWSQDFLAPQGFKNGTSGDAQIAIEAILSAAEPHTFLGTTKQGQSAIFVTTGTPDCHVILRGGRKVVNYNAESVAQVCGQLEAVRLAPRVMIDCSHANSNKDYKRQAVVSADVAASNRKRRPTHRRPDARKQLRLRARKSRFPASRWTYGQSITDGCLGWDETAVLLRELASPQSARANQRPSPQNRSMIAKRRAKGMKAALALAAILTIGVSTCGQLHAQSDAKENPHSQQIPNSDPDAHAQAVPNWAGTEGAYVEPIPNWRPAPPVQTDSSTVGQLTTSHIVEDLPLTGRIPIQTPQLNAQSGARQYPHAEKLPNPIVPSNATMRGPDYATWLLCDPKAKRETL